MQIEVDGAQVFATTGGQPFDADKPCVLFLHGASFDRTVWKLATRYFAWRGRSVLAVDMPGHGRSDGPLIPTIEGMAEWSLRLLDTVGARSAALVGHSMGAMVALEAAARAGERVRALALLGCAYPMRVNDSLLGAARANDHLAMDLVNSWGFGRQAQRGGHRMPGLWMMRGGLRVLEQSAPDTLYNDLNACNAYQGGEAAAEAVRCPTLLVLGERDMMTPLKSGRALAARIKGAEVVTIPGAGHIMMEEAPDETLDALKRIL